MVDEATDPQDGGEDLSSQLRRSVASAYAFVQGQETAESFSAVTFEELLDRQIERIEGPGTDIRPNILDRIRKVKEEVLSAVEEIKRQPDDFFTKTTAQNSAVSPVEPTDPLDDVLSRGTVVT